ncbi:MAG: hypothetical protein M0T72_10645 [Candidatus Dormibacteraeota bacterium]|nr:hypothetical protein [Candidatus Dormibacteraeota bacterium]
MQVLRQRRHVEGPRALEPRLRLITGVAQLMDARTVLVEGTEGRWWIADRPVGSASAADVTEPSFREPTKPHPS